MNDLVEQIYAAAVDASQWQPVLDEIVDVLHARRGVLMLVFAEREDFNVLRMSGWTPNEVELYFSRYASIDLWRAGAARWPEGKVRTDRDLCSRQEAEASEAYREFYAPKGAAHGCGTSILAGPYGHSMLTIMRSLEDGPFEESELAILRGLTAHLKRAALLHSELGSLRTQLATFISHLERSLHPFLLTDPELRVLYENARARELAALGQVVIIESSRLRLASARLDRQLRQIIVKMNGSCDHDLEWLEVPRGADQMPLRMLILKSTGLWGDTAGSLPTLFCDSDHRWRFRWGAEPGGSRTPIRVHSLRGARGGETRGRPESRGDRGGNPNVCGDGSYTSETSSLENPNTAAGRADLLNPAILSVPDLNNRLSTVFG